MPYGTPVIAIRLLDYDSGDETEFGGVDDQVLDYVMNRIISFKFSDHDKKKDTLEMVFRNEDYAMLDKPVFVKGQKLEVTWGWKGDTAPPRRMIVKKVHGGHQVTVTCYCPLSLLDNKKRSRFMEGATDSEFVRMIADEYGYRGHMANIEETTLRRDITQPRWSTDAKMCQRLAKRNGFQFYIDASGLHWHKRDTSRTPVVDFIYRKDYHTGDILEPPEFDANLTNGVAKVRVLARDPILKAPVEASSGINDEEDVSLGSEDELFDPDEAEESLRGFRISYEEVVPGGALTEAEAKAMAEGMYRDTAKKRYKGKLVVIGRPKLGAKMIIGLWGVSETFDGLYYVKEAISDIASGKFVMTLSIEKDALGKVNAAKKKNVRSNANKEDKKEEEEQKDKPKKWERRVVAVPDEAGRMTVAYMFIGPEGQTQQRALTEEEANALPQGKLRQLFEAGVTSYPDR